MHGTRFAGVGLSPDGRYLIANYRTTYVGGRSAGSTRITELASGKVLAEEILCKIPYCNPRDILWSQNAV